jgi:hypothetical protein
VELGSLIFGKFEWVSTKGKEYQMISLEIKDRKGGLITDIRGYGHSKNKEEEFSLRQ